MLNVWLKNPGDSVAEGEVLAEIETDKSVLDLESPSDGLLGRHLVSAGATVPVGHAIVRILAPGEVEPDDNTGLRAEGDHYILDGELSLKDVTKEVPLKLELNGFGPDPFGGTRAGFTATAEINRRDFGVNFSAPMETGGVVVSDKIGIELEIEAVLKA